MNTVMGYSQNKTRLHTSPSMTSISKEVSLTYLEETIKLAQNSPSKPTNFRVGCAIVAFAKSSTLETLSTGYTLELPGNTHAEQCALSKLASKHSIPESALGTVLQPALNAVLYTSLEPCGKRLSGNIPCVQRIIETRKDNSEGGIRKVIFGAKEPGTFVQDSQSCKLLTAAGIEWEYLPELEEEILKVAMEGHDKDHQEPAKTSDQKPDSVQVPSSSRENFDAAQHLPQRDEATQPRNPKKRMMEVPPDNEPSNS